MKEDILQVSRQDTISELSPWFDKRLEDLIQENKFPAVATLNKMRTGITLDLSAYRKQAGIENVVLGMSGGVDSAVTAALFKEAGWNVTGYLLPINQDPVETERGLEAGEALGIPSVLIDLSAYANGLSDELVHINPTTKNEKVRSGNIRARLRMIALYNAANESGALVASTDNFSELTAGFWTLHGDVGDLSPIQSLYKSWEVPMLARMVGVPKSTYEAKPTDGLGVDDGDEAQFGCSYLEWDIMLMTMLTGMTLDLGGDNRAIEVNKAVSERMSSTAFKRFNPAYLVNRVDPDRFDKLQAMDNNWTPQVLK